MKIINFFADRLKEKSTWIALVTTTATVIGVKISPELSEAIIATGLAITSLVLVFSKEKKK